MQVPGKTTSTEANATIKAALQTGITEGQKMIDAEVADAGTNINGWLYAIPTGFYGTDLFRAVCAVRLQGGTCMFSTTTCTSVRQGLQSVDES